MLLMGDLDKYSEEEAIEHIKDVFGLTTELDNYKVFVALIDEGGYEGYSYMLLLDNSSNSYYENVASHCSCYGFEDGFNPQETIIEYILSGSFSISDYWGEGNCGKIKDYVRDYIKCQ
jgi:hypothetical protein